MYKSQVNLAQLLDRYSSRCG